MGLWDGSLDKRKVRGLTLVCGHDGYRAQVPQHSIYRFIQIHNIHTTHNLLLPLDMYLQKNPPISKISQHLTNMFAADGKPEEGEGTGN